MYVCNGKNLFQEKQTLVTAHLGCLQRASLCERVCSLHLCVSGLCVEVKEKVDGTVQGKSEKREPESPKMT